MQGRWVPSLVREPRLTCRGATRPTHCNYLAHTLEPIYHNQRAHTPQAPSPRATAREKLGPCAMKSLCATTKAQHSQLNIIFKKNLKASELSTTIKCIMWQKRLNCILFQLKILHKTYFHVVLIFKQFLKIFLKAKIIWSLFISVLLYTEH